MVTALQRLITPKSKAKPRSQTSGCLYSVPVHTAKKRPSCNVVENRPEQYVAAHIVPGC